MLLVFALVALVVGSLVFHFVSPWWFTPLASNWGSIDTTINITFWVTGIVFVAVNLFLAYVVYRYRFSTNRRSQFEPENKKLESWLTILTAIGVSLMLAPGLVVWANFVNVPADAHTVEVVAQQWQWGFRFPGADGVLGKSDVRFVSEANPLGVDPDDANGQDDHIIDGNELHLPIGSPVKVLIRSKDVLHNFAVPQFRVKMDAVPGLVSSLWFTPTLNGRFDILCMELCGVAHYTMRGYVVVDGQQDYESWLAEQPTFAMTQAGLIGDVQAGEKAYQLCSSCHGAGGEGNRALNAPKLNGQSEHYLLRQLSYYRQGIRGHHPSDTLGQQMATMAATIPDKQTMQDLVAFIGSLPLTRSTTSLAGDIDKGAALYVSCGVCHGLQGEGRFSMRAPRLAGMPDWYLKHQLLNYRSGVRGTHAQDNFGAQMILMANMLRDEREIDHILAYIQTL